MTTTTLPRAAAPALQIPPAPKQSLFVVLGWGIACAVLAWAWQGADMRPLALVRDAANMGTYAAGFFPPDFTEWRVYLKEMIITLHIAIWGTALAIVLAIPCGLLHDLGHMLHDLGDDTAQQGVDDKHQFRALHLLKRAFGDAVLEPIRLHVDAKRYLCRVDAAYHYTLSSASKASLALQGNAFSAEEARRFILQPYARDAARLRTWDDRAKTPGAPTPELAHFATIMARCAL